MLSSSTHARSKVFVVGEGHRAGSSIGHMLGVRDRGHKQIVRVGLVRRVMMVASKLGLFAM